MILIVKEDGSASLSPQTVTAGTTAASIIVVSPFSRADTCALYFGLPNGVQSAPHVLTPSSTQEFPAGVAYEFRLTSDVVANRGTAEVIAEFTDADGAVFRSLPASFNVIGNSGISVPEYAETDPWAEVMTALSALSGTIGTIGAVVQTTGQSEKDVMSQKAVTDLFNELTYVAPEITTFTLTPSATVYKLPATFGLTKIAHAESNAGNISGELTLKRGATVIKSGISPSSARADVAIVAGAVTLSETPIYFTLSGTDKKGAAFSKALSVSGYHTAYIGAYEGATITTDKVKALTDVNAARLTGTRSVTFSGATAKYIWFCSTAQTISVTSSGFSVPIENGGTVTVNGKTYYCFRTAEKVLSGTHTFVIS